jgi:signal peptidase II
MFSKAHTALLALGVVLDQVTKHLAENTLSFYEAKPLISDLVSLQLVHNYGAAYGILQNHRWLLLFVSFTVLIGCVFFRHKIGTTKESRLALIFLLIGTIGNLIDRLFLGYVIDFMNIQIVPLFNLADVSIDIGIGLFLLDAFKINEKNTSSKNSN